MLIHDSGEGASQRRPGSSAACCDGDELAAGRLGSVPAVVVALELGEGAERTLKAGEALGRALGAPLVVVHAVPPRFLGRQPPCGPEAPRVQEAERAVTQTMEEVLGVGWRSVARAVVRCGPVLQVIPEVAAQVQAEAVVWGAGFRGGALPLVGRWGKVGYRRLMQATGRPCLLARAVPTVPLRAVLVPTDLGPGSQGILELVASWLRRCREGVGAGARPMRVRLLHVGEVATSMSGRAAVEARLNEELSLARRALAGLDVRVEGQTSAQAMPVDAIASAARSMDADLVAIGVRQRHPLARLIFSGTAPALLQALTQPVLIAPVTSTGGHD